MSGGLIRSPEYVGAQCTARHLALGGAGDSTGEPRSRPAMPEGDQVQRAGRAIRCVSDADQLGPFRGKALVALGQVIREAFHGCG